MKRKKIILIGCLLLVAIAASVAYDHMGRKGKLIDRKGRDIYFESLVEQIAMCGRMEHKQVGFAGELSVQYARFERLLKIATEEELVELTNHTNPVVRVYAFWGLEAKNYKELRTIYRAHIQDSGLVMCQSGCITYPFQVNNMLKSSLANWEMRQKHLRNKD